MPQVGHCKRNWKCARNSSLHQKLHKRNYYFFNNSETVETNVKDHFPTEAKIDHLHLKLFIVFSNINVNGKISTTIASSNLNVFNFVKF